MNWEALGAIGDFVGSLLVLITLVALWVQLRQTRKALSTNSYVSSAALTYESFEAVSNEFMSECIAKDVAGEELTRAEERALLSHWRGFIRRIEAFYHLYEQGLIPAERLEQLGMRLGNTSKVVPSFVEAWRLDEPTMLDRFKEWANTYVEVDGDA